MTTQETELLKLYDGLPTALQDAVLFVVKITAATLNPKEVKQ